MIICPLEHDEQVAVVDYCERMNIMVVAMPNGFFTNKKDKRFYGQINKLKKEGYTTGFPDLLIFLRGGRLIIIEMKRVKGSSTSKEQRACITLLQSLGFDVTVCKGAGKAIDLIRSRLN